MNDLYMLWTNADVTTSKLMVFMYAGNSKRLEWWDTVTVIIWGATAKLTKENKEIQDELNHLMDSGVNVIACKACADELDATATLEKMDIPVDYLGTYLTDIIKDSKKHLITI